MNTLEAISRLLRALGSDVDALADAQDAVAPEGR
jgi:hypothetical protein